MHGQAAEEIAGVILPDFIGNDQNGQEGKSPGEQQAVKENDQGRFLEIGQLRRFDFTVNMGQALHAAHGQNRVAEGHGDAHESHQAEPAFRRGNNLAKARHGIRLLQRQRQSAPQQQDDAHEGDGPHDPQRPITGGLPTDQVPPEKVQRQSISDQDRAPRRTASRVAASSMRQVGSMSVKVSSSRPMR